MKPMPEDELDRVIDALNDERTPPAPSGDEAADQAVLVRALKSLRDEAAAPAWPQHPQRPRQRPQPPQPPHRTRSGARGTPSRRLLWTMAAAVAAGLMLLLQVVGPGPADRNWVLAMDQAVAALESYHGVLETRTTNAAGETWTARRLEIWSDGDRYAVRDDDGVLTVDDGERRWQVRPAERVVAVLPPFPDARTFDLRDEAERAQRYPHEVVGRETVAGREAVHLRISPPGGLPYELWIDAETNMPLQLRTAMQNALQTTYTFVEFETNPAIDPGVFTFAPPEGYAVVEEAPEQLVATAAEAVAIAGFTPPFPEEAPLRILAQPGRIALDYDGTFVEFRQTEEPFEPATFAALGRAGGGPLEVLPGALRWRQDGLEVRVSGPRRVDLAAAIAGDLVLPDPGEDLISASQMPVTDIDLEAVRAAQQQVDAGSSPWQLDPVYVAYTFVNLMVSPEGIVGEGEIPFEAFRLSANTGAQAVVEVAEGPVTKVYLARLVRQDETGIWTAVGYDPRE